MQEEKPTQACQLLADLDAGLFERKLAAAITQAALGVINPMSGGVAKVTIDLKLKRISAGREIKMEHGVTCKIPTPHGEKTEKDFTETVVYVNAGGNITILPETQGKFTFGEN